MNLKNISKNKVKSIGGTAALVLLSICIVFTVITCVTQQIDVSTSDEAVYVSDTIMHTNTTTTEPTTQIITTEPQVDMTEEPSHEDTTEESCVGVIEIEADATDEVPQEYNYSDYELDLLARTIYQEAGICSEYCQWLVGSTVLNLADERGGIEAVVFDYNTFNVAYVLYDATPSDLSYSIAARLLSGDRDYAVKAFRTDYYHDFGTPYANADNVYFSTY